MTAGGEGELRYEIKMACQEHAYHAVRAHITGLPVPVHTLFPARRVQSIYMDTHFATALKENLAGISERRKLRFRWYGDQEERVTGHLELKVRTNELGYKKRLAIEHALQIEGRPKWLFSRSLAAHATPYWRQQIEMGREPVQWIRYDREYFSSHGGLVRITIDRHLEAFDLRSMPVLSARFPTPVPRILIIEVKAPKEHARLVREVTSCLRLKIDKCSKFAIASDCRDRPSVSVFPM